MIYLLLNLIIPEIYNLTGSAEKSFGQFLSGVPGIMKVAVKLFYAIQYLIGGPIWVGFGSGLGQGKFCGLRLGGFIKTNEWVGLGLGSTSEVQKFCILKNFYETRILCQFYLKLT